MQIIWFFLLLPLLCQAYITEIFITPAISNSITTTSKCNGTITIELRLDNLDPLRTDIIISLISNEVTTPLQTLNYNSFQPETYNIPLEAEVSINNNPSKHKIIVKLHPQSDINASADLKCIDSRLRIFPQKQYYPPPPPPVTLPPDAVVPAPDGYGYGNQEIPQSTSVYRFLFYLFYSRFRLNMVDYIPFDWRCFVVLLKQQTKNFQKLCSWSFSAGH